MPDSEFDSVRSVLGPAGVGGCVLSVEPHGWAGLERLSGGGVNAVLFFPFLVPIILSQYLGHTVSQSDEYGNARQE